MASIGGVSGSSYTSSLYNSANIISGLASGLDTESMIEGLVQSYQKKIQSLSNKATKLEWKQEAYRSIISKMYAFSNKYTSYTSATNLMSSAFFNSAIKIAAMGKNQDSVSASGRTDSDIKLTSVKQLAASARYSTASTLKGSSGDFSIAAEKAIKFTDEFDSGALSGSLVLNYGGKTVSLVFDSSKDMIADNVYKTDENGEYVLDVYGQRIIERVRTPEEKAEELKKLIEEKLGDTDITLSSGETKSAADLIEVDINGGEISFKDKSAGGNEVYISGASSSVQNALGLSMLELADLTKPNSFTITENTQLTRTDEVGSLLSGKTVNIALDGKIKSITLPKLDSLSGYMTPNEYVKAVQESLDKEFGAGKIKVTNESEDRKSLKLKFQPPDNSDLIINSDVGKVLGIENISTNFINTNKTLDDLMDKDAWDSMSPLKAVGEVTYQNGKRVDEAGNLINDKGNRIDKDGNELYAFTINGVTVGNYTKDTTLSTIMNDINNSEAGVKVSYSQTTRKFTFTTKETGAEQEIKLGEGLAQTIFGSPGGAVSAEDSFAKAYGLDLGDDEKKEISFQTPNGSATFEITGETTIEEIVRKLNEESMLGDPGAFGYTASYNETSGQIILTDKLGKQVDLTVSAKDVGDETGTSQILKPVSGSSYTPGQDSVFSVEINGEEMIMTRGSNDVSLDGLTLNLKGTFNDDYIKDSGAGFNASNKPVGDNIVTFKISTDSDKIVDAVKSMIADYNEMLGEIRSQYATLPYKNSSGALQSYEPLSDEDKASMSESAIANYEAKAKQGLLFGDRDLSSLYDKLRSIFTPGGAEEAKLQAMGISITYSSADGSASIALDENKLRSMLESDPDAVADTFTRTASSSSTNGVMQQLRNQLDAYGRTTGATKGILVEQAGSPLSPLTLLSNNWQKQIDNIGDQITKWQEKLSTQVDKYTSMFSRMETLISQMNSQSSTLAGLLGG